MHECHVRYVNVHGERKYVNTSVFSLQLEAVWERRTLDGQYMSIPWNINSAYACQSAATPSTMPVQQFTFQPSRGVSLSSECHQETSKREYSSL